ncbi:hypothetical protein ASD02_06910 [Ensifer sp. Root1252]|jgi:hypothetical protein|nr:hypothetical protein ASD00_37275 [Ensifer sp. Root31]KQW58704.1 hypothetical protein ASD02_06910 [Ensifer sp. Root1252]KQW74409.1 hypothetical protein ASD03_07550 [Ensifer sp. Root127]KQY62184.1 hypothetical protein ASD52_16320 [Ensifer sp. Root142]KRC67540.1 hypothetical protein ASE32_10370 [Ensifer sp. Root231]KRC98617.1 hypothetical protein ASE47_05565 [Ensifer sp. Root258]OMQ41620.1 hypothetical protein BKP54_28220 [Ensifer sp. 1H6]PSS63114.1 hypothetical protein C6558_19820 [Ensifer 
MPSGVETPQTGPCANLSDTDTWPFHRRRVAIGKHNPKAFFLKIAHLWRFLSDYVNDAGKSVAFLTKAAKPARQRLSRPMSQCEMSLRSLLSMSMSQTDKPDGIFQATNIRHRQAREAS